MWDLCPGCPGWQERACLLSWQFLVRLLMGELLIYLMPVSIGERDPLSCEVLQAEL